MFINFKCILKHATKGNIFRIAFFNFKTMKKFIFAFSFLIINFSIAQNLIVEYDLIRNTTTSDNPNYSEEFKEKILEREKKPEKYILHYADGQSYFESLPIPDVKNERAPQIMGPNKVYQTEISTVRQVKVYREKGSDFYFQYIIKDEREAYDKSKFSPTNQNYKDETQTINKYHCKLVEINNPKGEIVKIWYTEDLPISAGPFRYANFPGLVLKIEATNFVMYATKVSSNLEKVEVEKINPKYPIYEDGVLSNK